MSPAADKIAAQAKLFEVEQVRLSLHDRFLVPPFTVLDARAGYWQARKKDWISLGIRSELGRDEKLIGMESLTNAGPCGECEGRKVDVAGKRCHSCQGTGVKYGKRGAISATTSIFDPVLCEVVYRWFAPEGGTVLDPFAGGSVRGIVAGALGRGYLGVDLRAEQVESNYAQLEVVGRAHPVDPSPGWAIGDSRELDAIIGPHKFDAAFTCPPYYDLEVYSDDPRDLSNMEWDVFCHVYRTVVLHTYNALKDDSFFVLVVGEVRDAAGHYRSLVPLTVRAAVDAGFGYYNEAILLTMLGSTPIRVSSQFGGGRKLGKVHQNVLVFVKGDAKAAAARCPVAEVAVETGGAVWYADGSAALPTAGEKEEMWSGEDERL